jgi:hypothetical protein
MVTTMSQPDCGVGVVLPAGVVVPVQARFEKLRFDPTRKFEVTVTELDTEMPSASRAVIVTGDVTGAVLVGSVFAGFAATTVKLLLVLDGTARRVGLLDWRVYGARPPVTVKVWGVPANIVTATGVMATDVPAPFDGELAPPPPQAERKAAQIAAKATCTERNFTMKSPWLDPRRSPFLRKSAGYRGLLKRNLQITARDV